MYSDELRLDYAGCRAMLASRLAEPAPGRIQLLCNWAVEVKTGRAQPSDLRGLLEWSRRHPSYRPLVVGDAASLSAAARAGVAGTTWREFLLHGPPGARPLGTR